MDADAITDADSTMVADVDATMGYLVAETAAVYGLS